VNSETGPGCRDALVFLIKLFTKNMDTKKIQNENWAAKIKKIRAIFFRLKYFSILKDKKFVILKNF
jgi:hypothetical protein